MTEDKLNLFLRFCKDNGFDIYDEKSAQREAVLSNTKFIIPAGAGSGKTTVLSFRFIRLLCDGVHSDEILTMTFTNDATANMKSKIYNLLVKAVETGLVDKIEIEKFSDAMICTNDSLCSQIARQDCVRYGIGSNFTLESRIDADEFAAKTAREIVRNHLSDDLMQTFLSIRNMDEIEKTFAKIATSFFSITQPYNAKKAFEETIEECNQLYEKQKNRLLPLLNQYIDDFSDDVKLQDDVQNVENVIQAINSDGIICDINFSRKGPSNPLDKEILKELKSDIKKALEETRKRSGFRNPESQEFLRYMCLLTEEYDEKLCSHKRQTGALSFRDIMILAIDILCTNPKIREDFNRKYKYIMVDEFQDNNDNNRSLVYLLAAKPEFKELRCPKLEEIEKSKVFMVGDEKQSIYKFRDADVSVFRRINEEFGKDCVLALSKNFRSEKSLIDTINKMFSGKIMSETATDYPFEAIYTPLDSTSKRIDKSSCVDFLYNLKEENDSAQEDYLTGSENQAFNIAKYLKKNVIGNMEYAISRDGKIVPPGPEDIAILLKKYSSQSAFEKYLMLFDIPFNVTESKGLAMDAVFNDFYNIFQLMLFGERDEKTVLCALKSPFFNYSDEEIQCVHNSYETDGVPDCLREFLTDVKEYYKGKTVCELVNYLYLEKGYRNSLLKTEKNKAYIEHFDYLYSLASNYSSLVEITDYLRPILKSGKAIENATIQREKSSGVTIQSIHKSKGLDYPIVVVPCLHEKGASSGFSPKICSTASQYVLPFVIEKDNDGRKLKNILIEGNKDYERLMDNAESKRLLYVALTRAKFHVIMASDIEEINAAPSDEKNNSLLSYFLHGVEFDDSTKTSGLCRCIPMEKISKDTVYAMYKKEEEANKTEWYSKPDSKTEHFEYSPIKVGVTSLIENQEVAEEDTRNFDRLDCDALLNDEDITKFGTLVHKMIENMISKQTESYEEYFDNKSEAERRIILSDAEKLKTNFEESSLYESLKQTELSPEKRLIMYKDGKLVEGVIDLLSVSDKKVIIVDYKTDKQSHDSLHQQQLDLYVEAIKKIYPDKEVESKIFYLRENANERK